METRLLATNDSSVIIVGANGLIGNAVSTAASKAFGEDIRVKKGLTHRHNEVDAGIKQLLSLEDQAAAIVFFCHGGKGFSMRNEERRAEEERFRTTCEKMQEHREWKTLKVVLVSSLGCYLSNEDTAYKELVRQKELTLEQGFGDNAHIAMVPSIYGRHGDRRTGLIGTMLDNTLKGRITTIYGDLRTRRNYLDAAACGNALLSWGISLEDQSHASPTRVALCGRRSYSILEIVTILKRVLGAQPLVRFQYGERVHREDHITSESSSHEVIMVDSTIQGWVTKERSR